jgi:hypothetical protein
MGAVAAANPVEQALLEHAVQGEELDLTPIPITRSSRARA